MTNPTTTSRPGEAAPKIILPDDIVTTVRFFAEQSVQPRRLMVRVLADFLIEIPYGAKMTIYELIAAEWHSATGDNVSGRTVRAWIHSVQDFTRVELQRYETLSDAQLIAAVELSEIAKVTPQQICEWAIAEQVSSVPQMRLEWLPPTSTAYTIDPGWLSAIKNTANRMLKHDDPRWPRITALFAELRELLT